MNILVWSKEKLKQLEQQRQESEKAVKSAKVPEQEARMAASTTEGEPGPDTTAMAWAVADKGKAERLEGEGLLKAEASTKRRVGAEKTRTYYSAVNCTKDVRFLILILIALFIFQLRNIREKREHQKL